MGAVKRKTEAKTSRLTVMSLGLQCPTALSRPDRPAGGSSVPVPTGLGQIREAHWNSVVTSCVLRICSAALVLSTVWALSFGASSAMAAPRERAHEVLRNHCLLYAADPKNP